MRASLLTIGNEVLAGDVANTNAAWLSHRLAARGIAVVLVGVLPDEVEPIAEFVRRERTRVDYLIVAGGLGGTPDDLTREALAAAFGVARAEQPELAAELRVRYARHPDYAARFALLPVGSRPLRNPRGGAPAFALENVWALPGLPAEMEAMFDLHADELAAAAPIESWRRRFATTEADIVEQLVEATARWPAVALGSYPRFGAGGADVEVVLKSGDAAALAEAVAWLEPALARAVDAARRP